MSRFIGVFQDLGSASELLRGQVRAAELYCVSACHAFSSDSVLGKMHKGALIYCRGNSNTGHLGCAGTA